MQIGSNQPAGHADRVASHLPTLSRSVWEWLVVGALIAVACLINIFVVPDNHVLAIFFAIAILLAALWFHARQVVLVTLVSIPVYLVTSVEEDQPALVIALGVVGLAIVGYFALELVRLRERTQAHASALIEADQQLRLSEERLRVGLSMAGVAVYNQDVDLRYTAVFNPDSVIWSDRVLGRTDHGILPPDEADILSALKRKVVETGIGTREDRALTIEGVVRIYDIHLEPLRNSAGKVIGLTGSSTDITERKLAEESRRFEATILSNIRDSVIATDLNAIVTYWNVGAEHLFGYSTAEVLGKSLLILEQDEDPSRTVQIRDRMLAGDEFTGELLERRKDGASVWVDIKISTLRNPQNEPIGFIRVATDITARKRLEAEREELLQREQAAMQQLQQFIALVAHDLDQPLTTIHGVAQLLDRSLSDRISDVERRRLRSIESATRRMSRLTTDLRQAVAIRGGHFTVSPGPMDLMDVARRVVAEQQEMTSEHNIFLSGPPLLMANWDRDRIVQCLSNLVSNAIKYSPNGGDVLVQIDENSDRVTIKVTDSGIGIDREQLENLFEPFSRVHDNHRISGTGLGLFICKGIVEAHGGTIEVESEPEHGSTFTVRLPRAA